MFWHRSKLSLTRRLVGLAALALLPALAALLYLVLALYQQREREVHELANRLGQLASLEIERIITGTEGTLRSLARAPVVRTYEWQGCSRYLADVSAELPQLRRVAVIDASGALRCSSDFSGQGLDVSHRPYFIAGKASPDMFVGEYSLSMIDGGANLPLAFPIYDGDVFAGVVVGGLDLAWLGARLKERDFPSGGALTIADRSGVILAREPLPQDFVGTRIPEAFMPLVRGDQAGSMEVTSQDGTRRVIGYRPPAVTGTGLYVSAGVSTEAAFGSIYSSTRRSLLIAGAGASCTFALAWLAGDRLIRQPVARMVATVESWKRGNQDARTGIARSSSELDVLANAIDDYMDALTADRAARRTAEAHRKLLVHELEHRVKNVLATVQAVASQTFRQDASADSLHRFRQRIAAMAETHTLLATENWESADLHAALQTALRPFGLDDRNRVSLSGPPLQIAARAVLALSMAVHELATNAAKYGALSHDRGSIAVAWRIEGAGDGARFVLSWTERGGPPIAPPDTRGFGTRMIETATALELSGEIELGFPPEGLVFRLDAPADAVVVPVPPSAETAA